jgi:hypothetical protein
LELESNLLLLAKGAVLISLLLFNKKARIEEAFEIAEKPLTGISMFFQ